MKLQSDDDIYRARLLYLGPPGYTLPFQLPYAQYGLFVALTAGLTAAAVALTGTWLSTGLAVGIAIFMTSYIWQHVNSDLPARKVIAVALTDWRAVRPQRGNLPRLSARHVRFSDIAPTGDHQS